MVMLQLILFLITLCKRYGDVTINPIPNGTPTTEPVTRKCQNLQPAIIIIIATIPTITIDALKCGSINNKTMIGAIMMICFKKPFPYLFSSSLFFTNIPA